MAGATGRNDVVDMTETERTRYGNVVFKNEEVSVRLREDPEGVVIVVHRMIDGHEYGPKGYVIGSNYLRWVRGGPLTKR